MDNFYIYTNSQKKISNVTFHHHNDSNIFGSEYEEKVEFIMAVATWTIIGIGLPLTLMAIYALYSQVQNDHVAPIYIINLLISDLIQFCCLTAWVAPTVDQKIFDTFSYIYFAGLVASVCFMVCIALERYLVVAHPLWYRCRRTIKSSVVVCALVWVLDLVVVLIFGFSFQYQVRFTVFSIFLLLPFPLFLIFLGGVVKTLSTSISVHSDEKRQIVGVLILVLLIYTLLFLPNIISNLADGVRSNYTLYKLSVILRRLSPLADLTLYIFMRKGTIDKLLSSVCCCRMDSDDTNSPSVRIMTTFTQSALNWRRKGQREKGEKKQRET